MNRLKKRKTFLKLTESILNKTIMLKALVPILESTVSLLPQYSLKWGSGLLANIVNADILPLRFCCNTGHSNT